MTKDEYIERLDKEIQREESEYAKTDIHDCVSRALILGRINGLLTAKLYAFELAPFKTTI